MPVDRSSDDESELDGQYLLGFLEQPGSFKSLLRHKFRSKVGGRPAWLDPVQLPNASQLECQMTGQTMQFLLQVYAPHDAAPSAFHRFIYVFISPLGAKLAQPGAVRALRCQLARHNPFYSSTPDEGDLPPPVNDRPSSDPWHVAELEAALRQGHSPPALGTPHLYPEQELVVEPEEEPEGLGETPQAIAALLQQQRLGEGPLDADSQGVLDAAEAQADPRAQEYARFAARVSWAPEQVLRYNWSSQAEALCPSSQGVPASSSLPPCPHCGSPRQFEFQVMPQLLNFLDIDASDPNAPDWGSLVVYTCARSCQTSAAYVEEHVWVQPP